MATTHPLSAGLVLPPTRVRYSVLAFLCALSFILYLDRLCINQAEVSIRHDLGLSRTQMGLVFGAFTIAYGLFEVPSGRWGDRYGSRGVLTRIVLWWSLFTALTGCVWKFTLDSGYALAWPGLDLEVALLLNGFVLLLVVRFLFGAGEAGALPNAARVIRRWFPPGRRGPAQGLINTSTLLGGVVAPVLAGYLIGWVGWRWSFVLFGSLGLVWAVAFYRWFRDDPARHPAVNEAERRLITGGGEPAPSTQQHPPVPWKRVLTSANIWLMGGVISCTAFVSYLYYFWYTTYLKEGRHLSRDQAGWLTSLVLTGCAAGCVLGGYLADAVVRLTGNRRRARRLIGCGGLSGAAVLLLIAVQCRSPVTSTLFTALAGLSALTTLPTWWGVVNDISGEHVGALFGLMNSLGVPGAFASQVFFGWFSDWRGELGYQGREQWDPGFYVCAGALLLGAVGWLFIDATKSAVEPPAPK